VASRLATDDEIELWHTRGWVVLDSLVGRDEIDEAVLDLWDVYQTPEDYHANSNEGRSKLRQSSDFGPGWDQFAGLRQFPLPSVTLNRLSVHPSIIDAVQRILRTPDVRLYQAQTWAKYTGDADYEQDMHCDRNHSLVPLPLREPYWHVEGFLFLSDVDADCGPTHVANLEDTADRDRQSRPTRNEDPELYRIEQAATGPRGSMLLYRPDVFHRGTAMTRPGGSRFLFNISYKPAANELVQYTPLPPRSATAEFTAFVAALDMQQLAAIGFPMPGDPVWDDELLEITQRRYPDLDLAPWRVAVEQKAAS
jgi:hypothetical protein